jgi:hypothetical protein
MSAPHAFNLSLSAALVVITFVSADAALIADDWAVQR